MFTVQSTWQKHCTKSPGLSDKCSKRRQIANDLCTKPISLSQQIHIYIATVTIFTTFSCLYTTSIYRDIHMNVSLREKLF